jgi:hypothetical protein
MKNGASEIKVDRISFLLGMINCFVEMVACGVKKLAISPPLRPEDYQAVKDASDKMVKAFRIKSHLEKSLLETDLQSKDFTQGKWSILYYADDHILREYLLLKKRKEQLDKESRYKGKARKQISQQFMRLLSYPENRISEKLSKPSPESPFVLVDEEER